MDLLNRLLSLNLAKTMVKVIGTAAPLYSGQSANKNLFVPSPTPTSMLGTPVPLPSTTVHSPVLCLPTPSTVLSSHKVNTIPVGENVHYSLLFVLSLAALVAASLAVVLISISIYEALPYSTPSSSALIASSSDQDLAGSRTDIETANLPLLTPHSVHPHTLDLHYDDLSFNKQVVFEKLDAEIASLKHDIQTKDSHLAELNAKHQCEREYSSKRLLAVSKKLDEAQQALGERRLAVETLNIRLTELKRETIAQASTFTQFKSVIQEDLKVARVAITDQYAKTKFHVASMQTRIAQLEEALHYTIVENEDLKGANDDLRKRIGSQATTIATLDLELRFTSARVEASLEDPNPSAEYLPKITEEEAKIATAQSDAVSEEQAVASCLEDGRLEEAKQHNIVFNNAGLVDQQIASDRLLDRQVQQLTRKLIIKNLQVRGLTKSLDAANVRISELGVSRVSPTTIAISNVLNHDDFNNPRTENESKPATNPLIDPSIAPVVTPLPTLPLGRSRSFTISSTPSSTSSPSSPTRRHSFSRLPERPKRDADQHPEAKVDEDLAAAQDVAVFESDELPQPEFASISGQPSGRIPKEKEVVEPKLVSPPRGLSSSIWAPDSSAPVVQHPIPPRPTNRAQPSRSGQSQGGWSHQQRLQQNTSPHHQRPRLTSPTQHQRPQQSYTSRPLQPSRPFGIGQGNASGHGGNFNVTGDNSNGLRPFNNSREGSSQNHPRQSSNRRGLPRSPFLR